jgi:hypothetical protein
MLKIFIIQALLLLAITNCHKEVTTNNYNLPKDTQVWFQTNIDIIATIKYYTLTKVYLYKWKENTSFPIYIGTGSKSFSFVRRRTFR